MSRCVENYVERHIKRYHDKIKRVCEPLEKYFGINYFTYHSLTKDGLWRPIVSRPDWADFYTDHRLYHHDPFLHHPDSYQSEAVLWTQCVQEPYQQKVIEVAKQNYDMDHGLLIIEKHDTYCEFFGFNAPTSHSQIYASYINDLPFLKKFCRYFKEELSLLLKKIDLDPVQLAKEEGKVLQPLKKNVFTTLSESSKYSFLREIRVDDKQLSKRERQCLSLYVDEMDMQIVATHLELSVRTIEFYLGNVKNKLGCLTKNELIKKGKELRSLGLIQ